VVEAFGLKNAVMGVWRKGEMPLTFQEKIRKRLGFSGGGIGGDVGLASVGVEWKVLRRRGGLTSGVLLPDLLPRFDILARTGRLVMQKWKE
jgi:hypothetical protein